MKFGDIFANVYGDAVRGCDKVAAKPLVSSAHTSSCFTLSLESETGKRC